MALGLVATMVDNGTILLLITVIVLPIAAVSFARSGSAWKSIGKGPYAIEQEPPPKRSAGASPAAGKAMQATEVRQMVEARDYRQRQRGEAPIDVEAEVERTLSSAVEPAPGADEELRGEVRQLVLARNERRLSRGQEPLDVEAEVERQLEDFIGSQ